TELRECLFVCPNCSFHHRINSSEYYEILFDTNEFTKLFEKIRSKDFLEFTNLLAAALRWQSGLAVTQRGGAFDVRPRWDLAQA
ncbi:MAG TPA: hypothetical protein PLO41_21315, partial [Rubrivivax sp.]|nr:hypothetical protein [Rubrivivax sp.]